MPTRYCLEAGCGNPPTHRGRCPQHNRAKEQDTQRAGRAIYNTHRWQVARRSVLYAQPLCPCGAIAVDVDHIHPLAQGGDAWKRSNLRGLCPPCHSAKTRTEAGIPRTATPTPST